MDKVRGFIFGCIIGFLIWHIQAWAYPIGYDELIAVEDAEGYMEEHYVDISIEVSDACEKYGEEYGIMPEIGKALVWRESRCTDATNGKCQGYAQINEGVHKDRMKRLGVTDIHDIDGNIHVAFDILSDVYKDTESISKALDIYNGNDKNGKSKYAKEILKVAYCLDRTGGD